MRLYSYLYKNRFGIYYLRLQRNGVDRRVSLKTRDPALARQYSYQFGANISPMKNNDKLQNWGLKVSPDGKFEATDINSKEDFEQASAMLAQYKSFQLEANLAYEKAREGAAQLVAEQPHLFVPMAHLQIYLDDAIEKYLRQTHEVNDNKKEDDKTPVKSLNMMKSVLRDLSRRTGKIYTHELTDEIVLNKWLEPRRLEVEDSTVKRDLTFIRTFSVWCAQKGRGYLRKPIEVSITVKKKNRRHYDHFLKSDMEKIVNHLSIVEKPWHFWSVLIAIYTGARAGEIAGIKVEDFETLFGMETVFINGTKNESSPRRIPIHQDLLEIGLLEYVERRRKKNAEMVFPVTKSETNGWGAALSKWFSYRKKTTFKLSKNKVFHSFRPTIIDAMKQALVNEELRCQYTGHEFGDSVHIDTYSRNKFRLETVQKVLEHINYSKYYENFSIDVQALKRKAEELLKSV